MAQQGSRDQGIKGSRGGTNPGARGAGLRGGFTLIELLIVIVVIGLLIAAIFIVGGRVIRVQKKRGTEQTMRAIVLLLDQHKEQNPLRQYYDMPGWQSFGPYPPYQLARPTSTVPSVWTILDGNPPGAPPRNDLGDRLSRDLGNAGNAPNPWVSFSGSDDDDDIRALYTYLRIYCASSLSQVPQEAIKPIGDARYVNPTGKGTNLGTNGLIDVLGFVDAWGVPLDYFLYVKIEWTASATGQAAWRVTDRVAVLRSRGVSKEEADHKTDKKDDWIFSASFPSPEANGPYTGASDPQRLQFARDGVLPAKGTPRQGGWVRAIGAGDLSEAFGYLP